MPVAPFSEVLEHNPRRDRHVPLHVNQARISRMSLISPSEPASASLQAGTASGARCRSRPAVQPGDVVLNEGRLAAQGRAAEATADRAPRMDIVRSAVRAAVVIEGPVDQ